MKIGIDARVAQTHRGMGKVFRYLLNELVKLSQDDEFILYTGPVIPEDLPSGPHVRVQSLPSGFIPAYEQMALRKAAKNDGVDVLWCPANTGPVSGGLPIVLTLHDVIFRHRGTLLPHSSSVYQRFGRAYTDWSASKIVRSARHVTTVSEFSKKEIQDVMGVPETKVSAIPHAVTLSASDTDLEEFSPCDFGIGGSYFFSLGATDPRKNTDFLIDTFLEFDDVDSTQLVVAGLSSTDREALKSRVGSHPKFGRLVLLEFISDEILAALYAHSIGFIFPSLFEGFGLPVLEAMHFGAPVLASNRTSIPEVGADAILYFDPQSKDELLAGMKRLQTDPELRSSLKESGKQRSNLFSWKRSAADLLAILRTAAV